jgi:hypothetical protein
LKKTWWLVAAAVVLYWVVAFFFWSLIDVVTPFAAPLLWLPVLVVTFVAIISAILLPIRRWKELRAASLLPLVFLMTAFVATRFVDFTELWLAANFRFRYASRTEVVRRVENRELAPKLSHDSLLITLPRELAGASIGGGQVVVQRDGEQTKVLFFTFRGVLSSFAGFVYASDGSPPKNGDFGDRFFVNRKVQNGWYYVSAH